MAEEVRLQPLSEWYQVEALLGKKLIIQGLRIDYFEFEITELTSEMTMVLGSVIEKFVNNSSARVVEGGQADLIEI